MKLSKLDLTKHNRLLTLFIISGFLLLAFSYISPQNPMLQTQSWRKIDEHILHQIDRTANITTKTSNDPQKEDTTDAPMGNDMQLPDESENITTTKMSIDAMIETTDAPLSSDDMQLRDDSENITSTITSNDAKPNATLNNTPDAISREMIQDFLQTTPICDFSDPRSNICNMTGDIRIEGNITTVHFVPPPNSFFPEKQEWNFSPQSRRIIRTKNVTVKNLHDSQDAPDCTIKRRSVPALVFSLGGLVGNIWHDFSDIIIPLVLASKPLKGEVEFVIRDYYPWFVEKYSLILKDLSHYEIVNFDEDKEVCCYDRATVGLLNHGDLGIDPNRAFDRFDMFQFRLYIRSIYSLPPFWANIPYKADPSPYKKPRLMLILRAGIRKFLNEEEVQEVIKKNGFELVVVEPNKNVNLTEFSKLVDSCDVLMGVHGAALTNFFFLRTNALMIQIIPYGHMDNFAFWYYGSQALEMKLRKIDYTIVPEESSLLEKYGWDHPVIKDPDSVNKRGYQDRMKYYWYEQDVRLNVTRFEPALVEALQLLNE